MSPFPIGVDFASVSWQHYYGYRVEGLIVIKSLRENPDGNEFVRSHGGDCRL